MTAVGFEPTPFRNGALSHRLRPLGQTVMFGELGSLALCSKGKVCKSSASIVTRMKPKTSG